MHAECMPNACGLHVDLRADCVADDYVARRAVQIGSFCKTYEHGHPSVGDGKVDPSGREECDHVKLLAELINDKSDGFLDDLLPYAVIQIAEANGGCVQGMMPAALSELKAALPEMVAAVGPGCSSDVIAITSRSKRSELGFNQVRRHAQMRMARSLCS